MSYPANRTLAIVIGLAVLGVTGTSLRLLSSAQPPRSETFTPLRIEHDTAASTISVYRTGSRQPIVTHNARPDTRPYMHPIAAPDGTGVLTEVSPSHHPHQTGLYWGFTRLNGRDYFHNRGGDYWRRVSATVTQAEGNGVRWETTYDLLDQAGTPVLTETQRWSMRETRDEKGARFVLDLEWRGTAKTDVTIGRYDYGGLFLRMPWREAIWPTLRSSTTRITAASRRPGASTVSSASAPRDRARPTGRSRADRPKSSAIDSSLIPAPLTTWK